MFDQESRSLVPVKVVNISKRFGEVQALTDINIEFATGRFFTLLGPSGCGKTTLLRIIAGFTQADSGEVWFGDQEVSPVPPWERHVGFVFQDYALWPHMTVFDNVAYGLRLQRLGKSEIQRRVTEGLSLVGLDQMANRFPGQLSGGQQQRVALTRAMVLEPRVLLLDEPLSNLDAKLRIEMRRELRRIQEEIGITAIYVTHDQEEALELSDVVAVMSEGHVEQIGTPEEIYEHPNSTFVASFIGAVTLLRGQCTQDGQLRVDSDLRVPLETDPELAGRTVYVAIRPENVRIVSAEAGHGLAGRVISSSYQGNTRRSVVEVASDTQFRVEHREPLILGTTVGLQVTYYTLIEESE